MDGKGVCTGQIITSSSPIQFSKRKEAEGKNQVEENINTFGHF